MIKSLCDNNTDIQKVKIYRTTNDRFSKSDYPTESTALIEGGLSLDGDTAVFNLSYALAAGDNYFWMAYDLSSTSNPGNKLDASIRTGGITINGTNYVASLQSPTGSSVIRQRYFFSSFEEFESESPHKPKGWVVVNPGGGKEATWESVKGGVSTASPTDPKSGQYNARSNYDDEIGYVSYLIAPLDLSLATKPKLTFYHAQSYRKYKGISDSLGLYYGFSINGPWTFVKNYTLPTPDNTWLKREIDLPDEMVTNNVYFAFKSTAQYGDGVCLDSVTIYESTVATRKIKSVTCSHPASGMAPQGSRKNPILRLDIGVQGNEGDLYCSSITVNSLNTSDEDIVANGVGLYATRDSVFVSPTLLKTGSFSSGKVTFNGFNVKLESGYNYFWVTYDIKRDAIPDNVIDAKIEVGDIIVSDGLPHPSVELSPAGNRFIEQAIFFDDFEELGKWSLEGDFEIGIPQGKGVDNVYSFPDPSVAYSLYNVLGTDLSEDGNYGRNLRSLATSPLISCKYFKNTYLNYARWLNAEDNDSAVIEYQYEGESKWNEFWSTTSTINEGAWSIHNGSVKNLFDRKKFRMRFRLGTTDNLQDFSGWNIDYFFLS
ncbi:MAG TPA: choice-of-anchor J domain-containing protein, partial [Bacteroidales bacterium]|nr:choice-of-anchor J domain-containing protein [Bacteroidales bacterium]